MTTIAFGSGGRRAVGGHYVYLRSNWADDWTYYPNLHCLEATWAAAPTMPTATVQHDYGAVKGVGDAGYSVVTKLTARRAYVKVVFTVDTTTGATLTWYGVVADVEDAHGGLITVAGNQYASGQQKLYCYGMEYLLAMDDIRRSKCMDSNGLTFNVDAAIGFNEDGKPNRSRTFDAGGMFVFDGGPFYISPTLPESNWWSTRAAVGYLLKYAAPVSDSALNWSNVPWQLLYPERLDNTDRPVVPQEHATPYSILTQLIDRRRLRSFATTVNEVSGEVDVVQVEPFTLTTTGVTLDNPEMDDIPANLTQYEIVFDGDELTSVVDHTVDTTQYDQVIVRGRHRRSVGTFYVKGGRFESAWTTSDELAYEAAAKAAADYASLDDLEKRTRNEHVRGSPTLAAVYSWFHIPDDWDGNAGYSIVDSLMFPATDDAIAGEPQYVHGNYLETTLPLLEGVDYSSDLSSVATPVHQAELAPFVIFKKPGTSQYVTGSSIATALEGETDETNGANNRWSASVRVQSLSRTCEINVSGEPQHVIASTDFNALPDDRDLGNWDYYTRKMLVTLCVRDNRRIEAAWPPNGLDGIGEDLRRHKVIYVGAEYKKDYIAADTVVDVDDDGALIVCDGGFINDDEDRLLALAKLAFAWYGSERHAIMLSTYRLNNLLVPGSIITTIGDSTVAGNQHYTTVNAPVTEVRITTPILQAGANDEPLMTITTSAGEIDFINAIPPTPRGGSKLQLSKITTSLSGEPMRMKIR